MAPRVMLVAPIVGVLLLAGPAFAQSASSQPVQTITATGTGQTRVHPKNRHSNASIAAAVDAARKASIGGALSEAREYALDYARAAGMTLGSVVSISDAQANGYIGPGESIGPFGPGRYCGTVQRLIGKPQKGKKPRFRKVHRCFAPPFAYTTLSVTYSAS